MIVFVCALLLLFLAFLALILEKTYFYLPPKELKRQAAHGHEPAVTLFRAATYGTDLKVLLWLVLGISAAGGFVLFEQVAPAILGFIVIVIVLLLGFIWLPRTRLTAIGAQLAVWCTPGVVSMLRIWHPIGKHITAYMSRHLIALHTGMYDRDDISDLIEHQRQQVDNRITDADLERMHTVLHFGDYHVSDVLIPHRIVQAVSIDEQVSPVLVNELHESGHQCFPVYEGKSSNIVGTLPLGTITDIKHRGSVRDYYDEYVAYVHEQDSLEQALRAFYETRQHIFVVVNNSDQYVGIITLRDILHRLVGSLEHEKFDHYDDRKAVALRHHQAKGIPTTKEVVQEKSSEDL